MTSHHAARPLPPHEHLRQLHHVYGPLSPAFAAEELGCSLEEAVHLLYGSRAAEFCWVSLADLAHLSAVGMAALKRWVQRHHLQNGQRGQGRTAHRYVHLDDARHFLFNNQHLTPGSGDVTADALPRVRGEDLWSAPPVVQTTVVDVDWRLARQAAWPMTVARLAEAVYGSRAVHAQHQTRKTLRRWEAQGRVVCFARGLYDLVRPSLVLDQERYGRSVLPREDLQKLRAHHPEIAHWAGGPLAAAWRAYSHFYARRLLAVVDRGEPTLLEYLMVRQLNPDWIPDNVDAHYEEICREAAFYRLLPAPLQGVLAMEQPVLTVENIEAGLIDFQVAAEATRLKMQRHSGRGRNPDGGRRAQGTSGVQERA